jgi:heavy metal sensor kinase
MPFKLKIALLSLVISGLVIVGFGVFFLSTIHTVNLARIDRQLQGFAEPPLFGPHPPSHWHHFQRSLDYLQGGDSVARQAVQVRDHDGAILFTTPDCPAEIAGLELPVPRWVEPERHQSAPGGDRFVRRLDRDGDGLVSVREFDGPPEHFHELDRDGDGLLSAGEAVPGPRPRRRQPCFLTLATSRGPWRVGILGSESSTMIVATDLADFRADARRFRVAFLVALPVALLLLGVLGWVLAARTLRPVALITSTAESITARGLDTRVPPQAADTELERLVEVLNRMLDRLDRSFQQATRFSADAAHQLQTPLAVLQGELEQAIRQAGDGTEEQQRHVRLLEEVQRLKVLVQKLLLLARADAGTLALDCQAVDLTELLRLAAEDVQALAPDRTVELDLEPDVRVQADPDLLQQVIGNLTGNALRYGAPASTIRIGVCATGDRVLCTVSSTGPRIPPGERERVFDRFARGATAPGPGLGLGLSLAREIARAHGGDLQLAPGGDAEARFVLELPGA